MIMCSFLIVYMYRYVLTSVGSRKYIIWILYLVGELFYLAFGIQWSSSCWSFWRETTLGLHADPRQAFWTSGRFFRYCCASFRMLVPLILMPNLVLLAYLIINKLHPKVSQWLLPYFCLHLSFHHKISLKCKLSTCLSGAGYNVSLLALESKRLFLALSEFFWPQGAVTVTFHYAFTHFSHLDSIMIIREGIIRSSEGGP